MSPRPLARLDGRRLFLVALPAVDAPVPWPVTGRPFSLLLAPRGPELPSLDALWALARSALTAGAQWVVCLGPWGDELENAFLDVQAENEAGGEGTSTDDVVVTAVCTDPLDEALWETWHLFADGSPPVVALLLDGDPAIEELRALSRDLRATFQRVLDRESEGD